MTRRGRGKLLLVTGTASVNHLWATIGLGGQDGIDGLAKQE